jgi:hypothetical protein
LIADQNFICISLYCFDFRLLRCILMFSHPWTMYDQFEILLVW